MFGNGYQGGVWNDQQLVKTLRTLSEEIAASNMRIAALECDVELYKKTLRNGVPFDPLIADASRHEGTALVEWAGMLRRTAVPDHQKLTWQTSFFAFQQALEKALSRKQ